MFVSCQTRLCPTKLSRFIEARVRPILQEEGGDILFKDFRGGTVWVDLEGSCKNCPKSSAHMQSLVENLFKHYFPEVKRVSVIDDNTQRHFHEGVRCEGSDLRHPFVSQFGKVTPQITQRLRFFSEKKVRSGNLQIECPDCRISRTIEDVHELLDHQETAQPKCGIVLCPRCAVLVSYE